MRTSRMRRSVRGRSSGAWTGRNLRQPIAGASGGSSPFYRPEPLSSGPEVRMYHLRGSLTRNTNLQIQVLGNASEAVTLNRPKRHHVAPESYLNNFASLAPAQKSPRLSVLIRRTGVIEHQVKTKDIFYRHFYDHLGPDGKLHGSAEKPLNTEVEEPGNKVIASLLDGKAITYPQTRHLARYLMVAIVRSLWFLICLRAVLVEHSKRHGYDAEVVPELTQRKQVELLRAFMGLPTDSPNVYRDDPVQRVQPGRLATNREQQMDHQNLDRKAPTLPATHDIHST